MEQAVRTWSIQEVARLSGVTARSGSRLAATVLVTITHLERGLEMPAEEMFEGFRFDRDGIDELEAAVVERTGQPEQPYFDEVKRLTAGWTDEQFQRAEREAAATEVRLLELLRAGVAADDRAVFAVLDEDAVRQREVWSLDADSYAQMGRAFASVPELRARLDARDPALADYVGDAMVAYADARLR